ncbi:MULTISPECIES: HK97 family phage prohead protease [Roseomonadaceae]|uniref:HK97 family phage prohead protease n=1 Tax=Falsiroseomonas oleicola TaxID=2801474 RepID=A0ABS6H7H5_9PROT|nr:hypothetical protein [Roseomonas oleicola]MBU8544326.1 hypothetical protein [Roseomonas oleicola]
MEPASIDGAAPPFLQWGEVDGRLGKRGFDSKARRIVGRICSEGPVQHRGADERLILDMARADLSLLNSGRAPVLLDHMQAFSGLIGVVDRAWVEGNACLAEMRIGPTARCAEVWDMIAAGMLQNISIGFRFLAWPSAAGVLRAAQWHPFEVSLVTVPADWTASLLHGRLPSAAPSVD